MKQWIRGAWALLALTGCNQQTAVSGTYLARYSNGAAQMQLTENPSQQVMGSIIVITVKPNGQAVRQDVSVTGGMVDASGKTLVLTVKPEEIFAQAQNVSGLLSRGSIDMQAPWGNSHFVPTQPGEFDAAVNALVAASKQQAAVQSQVKAQQEQADTQVRETAIQARHIQELTSSLAAYNNRIQGATWTPAVPREQEEKLVERARRGLDIQQKLRSEHRNLEASQAGLAVSQLALDMNQIKLQLDQGIEQGRQHLATFDLALSNTPCQTNASLQGCIELGKERVRYVATRRLVEGNLAQAEGDMARNQSMIEAISKQAGN